MNNLILMSGSSRAFLEAGYLYPKNLVEVAGVPIVQKVLEKLTPPHGIRTQNICIVQRDENLKYHKTIRH